MKFIASSQNAVIKNIKSLKNRKDRDEKGLFYVEGVRSVEEALKENADIVEIAVSEGFAADLSNEVILKRVDSLQVERFIMPDRLFKEISDTETPQGIMAVMRIKKPDAARIMGNKCMFLILDSIRDPGNMGTIIRTADGAGFSGVIITKGCVDVYNPKVLRSTMGSVFHIPVYQFGAIDEAISYLKSKGIKVYASHLEGAVSVYDVDMTGGIAFIIGSEAEGISPEAVEMADVLLKIPMPGRAESLNASIAAGIMMYEAVRQRNLMSKR